MWRSLSFLLSVLGLATFAMAGDHAADARPVVRIGIVAPLTGEMSLIGEDVTAWVAQAKRELQARPTCYRYEFFIEDDQLQAQQTVNAIRRLVGWNKVNVLLTYGSAPGVAAAPYANSIKIPHMAIAFDPRATVGDYNVSFLTLIPSHMSVFLEMLKKKGYHNLAIFAIRNASWQMVIDELHKTEKSGNISIVHEKIYVPGERDFRLGFQMMPQDKVDAMVFLSWSPEINILAHQAREQGIKKPIISIGGPLVLSGERQLFDGQLDVFFGDFDKANQLAVGLTGHEVYSSAGPLMHDEILLLADIYENLSGKIFTPLPTSEQVMTAIKSTKERTGILGTSVYHEDKYFYLPVYVHRVEKGGFRTVKIEDL
jgi:hypothetical protein